MNSYEFICDIYIRYSSAVLFDRTRRSLTTRSGGLGEGRSPLPPGAGRTEGEQVFGDEAPNNSNRTASMYLYIWHLFAEGTLVTGGIIESDEVEVNAY